MYTLFWQTIYCVLVLGTYRQLLGKHGIINKTVQNQKGYIAFLDGSILNILNHCRIDWSWQPNGNWHHLILYSSQGLGWEGAVGRQILIWFVVGLNTFYGGIGFSIISTTTAPKTQTTLLTQNIHTISLWFGKNVCSIRGNCSLPSLFWIRDRFENYKVRKSRPYFRKQEDLFNTKVFIACLAFAGCIKAHSQYGPKSDRWIYLYTTT